MSELLTQLSGSHLSLLVVFKRAQSRPGVLLVLSPPVRGHHSAISVRSGVICRDDESPSHPLREPISLE